MKSSWPDNLCNSWQMPGQVGSIRTVRPHWCLSVCPICAGWSVDWTLKPRLVCDEARVGQRRSRVGRCGAMTACEQPWRLIQLHSSQRTADDGVGAQRHGERTVSSSTRLQAGASLYDRPSRKVSPRPAIYWQKSIPPAAARSEQIFAGELSSGETFLVAIL